MVRRRYRQLFLFVFVLVGPSILIAVQGRKISGQERETRAREIEKRTAADIGQETVTRLERIKTQELANAPLALLSGSVYSDPAVVAVGWADGDRLVWPWDSLPDAAERFGENAAAFESFLRSAKRAEFGPLHDDRHAADLYEHAIAYAGTESARAAARFGRARVLLRSGDRAQAISIYRDLLRLPSTQTDGNHLSCWTAAAAPLTRLGFGKDVLERTIQDLESPQAWPPIQVYRFRSILDALRSSDDPNVRQGAAAPLERVSARLRDWERLQTLSDLASLQKEFSKLRVTSTDWKVYEASGGESWLIGRAPGGAAARPLVVALRLDTVRHSIESERLNRGAGPRFLIAADWKGEPLSPYLEGLHVTFPDGVPGAALAGLNPTWALSFVLVAFCTLFGGYLLWRDMRRESQMAELRTQFVSSVSHELKTPLTSIRMYAELLQMKPSADPQHPRFLNTIVSESERLTRLLNNVLDFSRIERGQKNYHLEPTPLADVVDAAVRTVQYPLSQQGFVLDLKLADGIPNIPADRDALQQAILNLLTNAMKYSGQSREIGLHLSSGDGDVLIQVFDHGIGIAESEQTRIFERFYRAPIPENREISGTGLGLALVAHIAQAHGGHVDVQSRPGEGSTFSIRLPLNGSSAA